MLQTTRATHTRAIVHKNHNIYKPTPPSPPSHPTPPLTPTTLVVARPPIKAVVTVDSTSGRLVLHTRVSSSHRLACRTTTHRPLPIPTVVDANDVTNLSSHLHPLIHSTSRSSLRRTSPTDTSHRCVVTGTSLRRIPALHHYVVIVHRYTLLLHRLPCVTLRRLRY